MAETDIQIAYENGYHDGYQQALNELNGKQFEKITRCKDCKHRPTKKPIGKDYDLDFPDSVCPCQNPDDGWYSYYPADDWYCADGERKEGDGNGQGNKP